MDSLRKRPHSDGESSHSIHKKHIIADENDAPRVNGTPEYSDLDFDAAKLETFRKQAIYRRMKYYSRENERHRAQVTSLQNRNTNSEEGLKALVSCWTQLVNTIHSLCPSDDSPNGQDPHPPAIYDMLSRQSDQQRLTEVQAMVDNSVKATRTLVTKFMASGSQSSSTSQNEAFQQCQSKCADLEVSYVDTRHRLDEVTELLETRESELETVQARYEYLKMSQRHDSIPMAPSPAVATPEVPVNGSPMMDLTQAAPEVTAQYMQEAEWLDIKAGLNRTIDQLKQQVSKYTDEVKQLTSLLTQIPDSRIHQTSTYIELKHAANFYEQALKNVRLENAELLNTVKTLTQEKATFQDLAKMAGESMEQDYQTKLEKRSAESARLRTERDQARGMLRERELKDGPLPSIAQLDAFQKSQAARLDVCRSEVKRLQARLAEQAGNTEILRFLFPTYTPEKADFAEHLQKRVKELEAHISQLQHDGSNLPIDAAQLVETLKERDEEINRYKVAEVQLRQNLTAAETDLNLVSSAYDDSEKQLKDKIFTLVDRDRALQEAQHLRIKAEQRYIAAQGEKDGKEGERITALRAKEGLDQVLTAKEGLISNLRASQREAMLSITTLKHTIMELENTKIEGDSQLQRKEDEWTIEKNNFLSGLGKIMHRETQLVQRETTLAERSESLSVERKKIERERRFLETDKVKSARKKMDPDAKVRELEKELENLKEFAKCKCCLNHYRTKVITTCMHSFCKDCIEDRIASRQRACMTCGVKFAQSDVKDLYH